MCLFAAFIVFQKYIVRGIVGRWKRVGDSFAQGRIYDPNRSVRCAANKWFKDWGDSVWYDQTCFENNCYGDCIYAAKESGPCLTCVNDCQSDFCDPTY